MSLEHINQLTLGLLQFSGLLSLFFDQIHEVVIPINIEMYQVALSILLYELSNWSYLYSSP